MTARCKLRSLLSWTEDRATVGTDPSADPAAKTKGGLGGKTTAHAPLLISTSLWDWHQSDKSQGVWGTGPPADYQRTSSSTR